jgi:SET domain-containing protein
MAKTAGADGVGGVYVFEVGEGIYLDGEVRGNAARFMNHSCAANCEAVEEGGRIWMTAARGIEAGEELTFDYGFRLGECLVHRCRCGAAGCAGYIVNRWERWRMRRWVKRKDSQEFAQKEAKDARQEGDGKREQGGAGG